MKRTRTPAATPQPEATVNVRELMTDPALLGGQFSGPSWAAWRTLLAGFYGLELDPDERRQFKQLTGRRKPGSAHDELWLAIGRRGGKSMIAALLAIYEAAFRDYRDRLAPGEIATVPIIAADRKQARVVARYVAGLLHSNSMLERMIRKEHAESIELTNRTIIEIHTASFRSVRGYTVAAAVCDELAYWRTEDSANPDHEIIQALRPAMATLGGKLIALSSPYARRGELWQAYKNHHGKRGPVLVAQAASRTMNPALPKRVVDEAYKRDPVAAAAEYGAEFRTDIESFLTREVIEAAQRQAPLELPYNRDLAYTAFCDPAGGGSDEFALALGHREDEHAIVDVLRARHGKPASIVEEFAKLLKAYGISGIQSDRYAGSWPSDEFARHGITCTPSAKAKSDLYLDTLATLNSERAELPPDDRLLTQFTGLERRTSRGGRDSIDHGPGGHDDRANACAGLIVMLTQQHELTVDDFELISVGYGPVAQSERVWHPAGSISEAIHPDHDDWSIV